MDIFHSFVFAVAFLELQHMCRALEHCHHLLVIHIKLHGPSTSSVHVYAIGMKLGNYATQLLATIAYLVKYGAVVEGKGIF